jgi:protein transport protein SEC24
MGNMNISGPPKPGMPPMSMPQQFPPQNQQYSGLNNNQQVPPPTSTAPSNFISPTNNNQPFNGMNGTSQMTGGQPPMSMPPQMANRPMPQMPSQGFANQPISQQRPPVQGETFPPQQNGMKNGSADFPPPPANLQQPSSQNQFPTQPAVAKPMDQTGMPPMPTQQHPPMSTTPNGPPPAASTPSGIQNIPPPIQSQLPPISQNPIQQQPSGMPPMPAQANQPQMARAPMGMPPTSNPTQGVPPISNQNQPPMSQPGMPPLPNQVGMVPMQQQQQTNQFSGMPPMPQPPQPQFARMPPMNGQQQPQQMSGMPPMPGQMTQQRPTMPGQQPMMGGIPPMPGQQQPQIGGMPPMPGQQQPQMGGMPPMPGQQPMMGGMPPMPGQQPQMGGMPPMPGQQPQQQYQGMSQQNRQNINQPSHNYNHPGQQFQQYQQSPMQSQPARRLDPDQMPNPIQVMSENQKSAGGVFSTVTIGQVPPLVTTNFVTQDQGNSGPRYVRSTMYNIPATTEMMKQSAVPFALVVSPFAKPVGEEMQTPIVDFGEIGPIRCVRCKAYMSPYMQFIDAGRRFQCLLCKATTEGEFPKKFTELYIDNENVFLFFSVPAAYFQHLDHTGQRADKYERPELVLGTYEFLATKDYCRVNITNEIINGNGILIIIF